MVTELQAGLAELVADPDVKVILVRGEAGSFCAGLDLDAFAAMPPPTWRAQFGEMWAALHTDLYMCPKPTVAALEGAAIAAGSALALACDQMIAAEHCRFQVAEARFGLTAPINSVWLHLKYSPALALELAAGAQPIDGAGLVRRGLAIDWFADTEVLEAARTYADKLAQNNQQAVAAVKGTIRALAGIDGDGFRTLVAGAQEHGKGLGGGPGRGLRGDSRAGC